MQSNIVYLLHLSKPYKHARHYVGWTVDLETRLQQHARKQGARLLEVVQAAGITWSVARTWPGGRTLERQIKNRKDAPRLCPVCAGDAALRRATRYTNH